MSEEKNEQKVVVFNSGKISVFGNILIEDEMGNKIAQNEKTSLCGCKKSKKMPFCDGSHKF